MPGGNGDPRLYYLATGPQGGGPSLFRLRVTNRNSVFNLMNPSLKVRLLAQTGPGETRVVPLTGQGEKPWKTMRTEEVEDERSRVIPLHIDASTRRRAYDPDHPLHWLEVEFHWYEANTPYYKGTRLAFNLVESVELLLRQRRLLEDVSLNDRREHLRYWVLLHENRDPSPQQFRVKLQTTRSASDTSQLQLTATGTTTRGVEQSQQTEINNEATVGLKIDGMFELGQKYGTKMTSGVRWNESVSRTFTESASRSSSFMRAHTEEFEVSGTIPAAPRGKAQALYAYPVIGVYEVPVVLYDQPNELGQATRRRIDTVPIAWIRGWGTDTVLR